MAPCPSFERNFLLVPIHSYDDLYGDSLKESSVDRDSEQLFSIENSGDLMRERNMLSTIRKKIVKFKEIIVFKNICY